MPVSSALIDFVRPILRHHEGDRPTVYPDSLGISTIGVGLNLEQPGARSICEQCGADYDALLAGTASLTPQQTDSILNHFIVDTAAWLSEIFPNFAQYSVPRQAALVDMGFMGAGKFSEFHNLIAAVKMENWNEAAAQALQSLWAKQVGQRAHDDAALLTHG